jgi:hypothetical protein
MKNKPRVKITIIFLFLVGLAGVILFFTRNPDTARAAVDAMERRLEISRHEQLLVLVADNDTALSSFTTDGCSGGLSIGWEQIAVKFPEFASRHGELPPWQECCIIHDQQYHSGGSRSLSAIESFEQRKKADLDLKSCVVDTGALRSSTLQDIYGLTEIQIKGLYEATAELMYRAVRVGGIPCTTQSWRWGYGWPRCRPELIDSTISHKKRELATAGTFKTKL